MEPLIERIKVSCNSSYIRNFLVQTLGNLLVHTFFHTQGQNLRVHLITLYNKLCNYFPFIE